MWKKLGIFCLVATLMLPWAAFARPDYAYKKPSDFKTLESFKSIADFEAGYGKYVQHCLDNTGGGTGGISCLIGYEMWDREMNVYYQRLMKVLGKKEQDMLKESQRAWIAERDRTIAFNSALLDWKYDDMDGTMYALMRAGDADETMTPIVKQRALLLKGWLDLRKKGRAE